MEDKVGSKLPSQKEVASIVEKVQEIRAQIAPYTVGLNKEERQRTLKFRIGGEAIVALVGKLATKLGLTMPNISVDGMNADVDLAKRLEPLEAELIAAARRVSDTRLEALSEAWFAATAFYTALARLASTSSELADELQPAVDFFAIGRRAKTGATPAAGGDGQAPGT